jgi:hypothetical protein
MFSVVAFSQSQDLGLVEGTVAGVVDQHMEVVNNDIWIGSMNLLLGAFACAGATATQCRLVSPSLRRVNAFHIAPLELALTPAGIPHHNVSPSRALPLDINESIECLLTSDPAAAERASVAVWLSDKPIQLVSGKIYTVRFTITVTLVAGAWAFSPITLPDNLPVGVYKVVGGALIVAAGVAWRFVPVGAYNRPGAPTLGARNFDDIMIFRNGNIGEWFTFSTMQLPAVEVLSSAAAGSATYQGYMDITQA